MLEACEFWARVFDYENWLRLKLCQTFDVQLQFAWCRAEWIHA